MKPVSGERASFRRSSSSDWKFDGANAEREQAGRDKTFGSGFVLKMKLARMQLWKKNWSNREKINAKNKSGNTV